MGKIVNRPFGVTADGQLIEQYTLYGNRNAFVQVSTLGGCLTAICVPDRQGGLLDVALGFDTVADYEKPCCYMGALVGRHCNRIGGAQFELHGHTYKLCQNNGPNHLHGGAAGFDKKVWRARVQPGETPSLVLTYFSRDGEEGYPGNLNVSVTYTFDEENRLTLDYMALSDQDTVVNLTNHSYFNLDGHAAGHILGHRVRIHADAIAECDSDCLPTGVIAPVEGTPFDFRSFRGIGERIDEPNEQLTFGNGYDHNFVLNRQGGGLQLAAEAQGGQSGIYMRVFTTMPGIQFYTGNSIEGELAGKGGARYGRRDGFCMETQYFPNAIRHKHFPSPILLGGKLYHHTTVYAFSNEQA